MKQENNPPKEEKENSTSSCTRRNLLKGAGLFLLSSLGCSTFHLLKRAYAAIHIPKEINIGIFGPSHCAVPFVVAKLKNLFKEEGLKVNLINYPSMPLIAKDLLNGTIDFGQLTVPLAFAIHSGTTPLFPSSVSMAVPLITGTNGAALMVKSNLRIKNPLDFKGKIMANHSKLSVHYFITMMFLEKHGLNLKDINFKIIELDKIMSAMQGGKIDTFVMPEPKDALAEYKNIAEVYMHSRYIWQNHPCCAFVMKKSAFDKSKDTIHSVTRSIMRGALIANAPDSREEIIDLIRSFKEYKYSDVPHKVLLKAFIPGRSDFYPFPFLSAGTLIAEEMKKHHLLDKSIDEKKLAKEVFLSDFSRSIMKELGEKPPLNDYRTEKILGELRDYS